MTPSWLQAYPTRKGSAKWIRCLHFFVEGNILCGCNTDPDVIWEKPNYNQNRTYCKHCLYIMKTWTGLKKYVPKKTKFPRPKPRYTKRK